jgi:hypothetical protein
VGIRTGYELDQQGIAVRVAVVKNFIFFVSSSTTIAPNHSLIKWLLEALSTGLTWSGE